MTSHPKFDFANVVDFERINATNDITQSNTNVTSFVDVNRNALMLLTQKFDCERIIHFLDEVTFYSLTGCVHGQLQVNLLLLKCRLKAACTVIGKQNIFYQSINYRKGIF